MSADDERDVERRLSFDLIAAALRADEADAGAFLEALAVRLEGALPQRVAVERSGLFGRGGVRRVAVTLGEDRFSVAGQGRRGLICQRAHVVGGIVLRRDQLDAAGWVDALARALYAHAETTAADRAALERLLLE